MIAAVIPVRGGSKRIPRKNVKDFCGLPLMAWAIIQAKVSHLVDEVYVTTDDDELADVAVSYGARVIRRPDWPDADTASGGRPIKHAVKVTPEIDEAVFSFATMPCQYPDDIDRMIRDFRARDLDRLCAFAPHREPCIYQRLPDGWVRLLWLVKEPDYMEHTCGLCVVKREHILADEVISTNLTDEEHFRNKLGKVSPKEAYIEFKPFQTTDCDTLEEWELSETLMEHYILKGRGRSVYDEYGGQT